MKVEDLMTTDVGACRPFDSVDRTAKVMWERDCGAVPVVDQEGRAIAMLTDRDICMAALTQGKPLEEIHVSSAMSRRLWSCRPQDDVKDAEKVMRAHQVRRLPVMDLRTENSSVCSRSAISREPRFPRRAAARRRKRSDRRTSARRSGAISSPASGSRGSRFLQ